MTKMKRACIAAINAAHARLFAYDHSHQPALHDEIDLVNPGRQAHQKFSTTKPGNRWQEGGRGSTDDHRTAQIAEHEQRFADQIVNELVRYVVERGLTDVILAASPRMLGTLRTFETPLRQRGVILHEMEQDLAWMTPAQLHDHLAELRVIEPRSRAPTLRL